MKLKTIEVKGVKIGLKTLKATEIAAISTMWGLAGEQNDFEAYEKVYARLLDWIEVEIMGTWLKAYDPAADKLIVPAIEKEHYDPVFLARLVGLLEPFMQRSDE